MRNNDSGTEEIKTKRDLNTTSSFKRLPPGMQVGSSSKSVFLRGTGQHIEDTIHGSHLRAQSNIIRRLGSTMEDKVSLPIGQSFQQAIHSNLKITEPLQSESLSKTALKSSLKSRKDSLTESTTRNRRLNKSTSTCEPNNVMVGGQFHEVLQFIQCHMYSMSEKCTCIIYGSLCLKLHIFTQFFIQYKNPYGYIKYELYYDNHVAHK